MALDTYTDRDGTALLPLGNGELYLELDGHGDQSPAAELGLLYQPLSSVMSERSQTSFCRLVFLLLLDGQPVVPLAPSTRKLDLARGLLLIETTYPHGVVLQRKVLVCRKTPALLIRIEADNPGKHPLALRLHLNDLHLVQTSKKHRLLTGSIISDNSHHLFFAGEGDLGNRFKLSVSAPGAVVPAKLDQGFQYQLTLGNDLHLGPRELLLSFHDLGNPSNRTPISFEEQLQENAVAFGSLFSSLHLGGDLLASQLEEIWKLAAYHLSCAYPVLDRFPAAMTPDPILTSFSSRAALQALCSLAVPVEEADLELWLERLEDSLDVLAEPQAGQATEGPILDLGASLHALCLLQESQGFENGVLDSADELLHRAETYVLESATELPAPPTLAGLASHRDPSVLARCLGQLEARTYLLSLRAKHLGRRELADLEQRLGPPPHGIEAWWSNLRDSDARILLLAAPPFGPVPAQPAVPPTLLSLMAEVLPSTTTILASLLSTSQAYAWTSLVLAWTGSADILGHLLHSFAPDHERTLGSETSALGGRLLSPRWDLCASSLVLLAFEHLFCRRIGDTLITPLGRGALPRLDYHRTLPGGHRLEAIVEEGGLRSLTLSAGDAPKRQRLRQVFLPETMVQRHRKHAAEVPAVPPGFLAFTTDGRGNLKL